MIWLMRRERETVTVPLIVSDFDAAISFYCGTTEQFEVEHDITAPNGLRNVCLGHITLPLSLGLRLADTPEKAQLLGRQSGDRNDAFLILPVAACEPLLQRLQTAGMRVEDNGIIDLIWGSQLCCYDPFGTMICFIEWNPYFGRA